MKLQGSIKVLALIATTALVGAASAQIVNGSFEQNGNFSTVINGWQTYGNNAAFTANTTFFSDPTDGQYQAHVSSNTDGSDGEPDGNGLPLIYSPTGSYAAEDFLGVAHGALQGVGNGNVFRIGAIKQSVLLRAGDQITFDYRMLTSELYKSGDGSQSDFNYRPTSNANDFVFFTSSVGGVGTVTKLVDTFYGFVENNPGSTTGFDTGFTETPFDNTGVGDIYFMETPALSYTFTATTTGLYTIGFGVTDAFTGIQGNSGIPSGISVDNVRLTPVPEPASLAALGFGLAAFARRQKKA